MMNTQLPILNVANMQNATRPTMQADSFTADVVPFNQVLNKEVSNRNTDNQSKPNDSNTDTSPDPVKASTAPAASAPAKSDTTKTASSDDKKDDDQDSDDTTVAESAQMLALVANMSQIVIQPVDKKTPEQDMDVLASQKGGKKTVSPQLGAADAKADLTDVQADDKGKGNASPLDFAALQNSDKETPESKSEAPVRATATTMEKTLPDSSANTKSLQADLQDATAAARNVKVVPEALVKQADTQVQPNASTVVPALQQAMTLAQQAAMSGQAVQRLTPAVGSQGWDQAVGQKVIWMANGGLQSASLTLNPPDLGPLQVVLHVNNQQADATFITAQPEVKQALEAAMPKLREMMDQAGIQLGQATVNTGTPNQQQGAGQQQARSNSGSSNFGNAGDDDADVNVAIVPRPATTGGQGLVDTFA